ncbi:MAG: hypothetical protein ACRBCJ_09690 [Hyphomicrobiaceae bacterium]
MRLNKFLGVRSFIVGIGTSLLLSSAGLAQDAPGATSPQATPAPAAAVSQQASTTDVAVELNKLETLKSGCRAYIVVNNASQTKFKTLKLELALFRPDGIIGRRVAIDLAPLRAKKRTVKLFDMDGIACDQVGSILINDVLECSKQGGGEEPDCLGRLSASSRTKAELLK